MSRKNMFVQAFRLRAKKRKPLQIEELEPRSGGAQDPRWQSGIQQLSKRPSKFELPSISGEAEFDDVRSS